MRTFLRLIPPAGILASALLFPANRGSAKPEYTRRTKKDCEFCHPPDSRELNVAGKYFQEHGSLQGYVPPPDKPSGKPKDKPSGPSANSSK